MKKLIQILTAIFTALLMSNCSVKVGSDGGSGSPNPASPSEHVNLCATRSAGTEGWTTYFCYYKEENVNGQGCTTGKREFSSANAYCQGLLDDSLNNFCARDARQRDYNDACI